MQALCMRLKSNLLGPTTLAGVIAAVCLICGPAGGDVQNGDVAARLPAAEAQAHHLSQQIDNISKDSGEIRVAQHFGESDEEKAARLQKEQAQDSSIATLNQRVGDLEETVRRLTGQVEELDHRLSEFGEKLSRVRKEFDYKICALAAQQLGAGTNPGEENALPCGGSAQQSGPAAPSTTGPSSAGSTIHLAPP